MDLFYVGLAGGFFLLSVLLAYGCEKLRKPS
jgi:hypothetical protein